MIVSLKMIVSKKDIDLRIIHIDSNILTLIESFLTDTYVYRVACRNEIFSNDKLILDTFYKIVQYNYYYDFEFDYDNEILLIINLPNAHNIDRHDILIEYVSNYITYEFIKITFPNIKDIDLLNDRLHYLLTNFNWKTNREIR